MSGHTPGPWHISGCVDDAVGEANLHIGAATSPMVLCSMNEVHTHAKANACLMVNAPDLLEALKPFADACTISTADDDDIIDDTIAATKIRWRDLRLAYAAIAKATGATS